MPTHAAAALDRAEAAARRAVAPARKTGQLAAKAHRRHSGSVAPWDPLGPKERLAVYLRASNELHHAGAALRLRHQQEEHLMGLDRQIAQVEKTRAMFAAAYHSFTPPASAPPPHSDAQPPHFTDSLTSTVLMTLPGLCGEGRGVGQCLPPPAPDGGGKPSSSRGSARARKEPLMAAPPQTSRTFLRCDPVAAAPGSAAAPRAERGRGGSVIELRPVPCSRADAGADCTCCLCPVDEGEAVLAFPCPAQHVFHAACLHQWLRAAGGHSTCPMCRAWPRSESARQRAPSTADGAADRPADAAAAPATPEVRQMRRRLCSHRSRHAWDCAADRDDTCTKQHTR
mmetsp:Transcript_23303/g.65208  ORF Transcript_23303/g.65208 Transcript_23303/m.65208 type:complete len:341 (+) Transcript_23303:117-1139(+)